MIHQSDETAIDNKLRKRLHRILCGALSFLLIVCMVYLAIPTARAATVKTPTIRSVSADSPSAITVKWTRVHGAQGYILYQKKADGNYAKMATIKSGATLSYTKKGLPSATKYSYRIKAYVAKNGKTTYSAYSKVAYTYTKPTTPTITSVKATSGTTVTVNWKKVTGAKGYVVYQKSGNDYKRVATISSGNTTTCTIKGLKTNRQYTFVVRATVKSGTKTVYSSRSAAKSVKTTIQTVTVWIPQSGKKYHARAGCSNMSNPSQVTVSQAVKKGFTPCKRCYG